MRGDLEEGFEAYLEAVDWTLAAEVRMLARRWSVSWNEAAEELLRKAVEAEGAKRGE
ncbi:MAG: hypothetical protein GY788_21035 [bacterium]|nr:hypothetical protein [bacterium]